MPFMLGLTEGTEMLKPLGVAVIGGITWSLVITFVLVPIIYYTFNKKRVLMPKQ
jgi:HAE1 family hydrophobic/amphiphilic exporter-1